MSYKDAAKNLQKYARQYLCPTSSWDVLLCVWIMCGIWTEKGEKKEHEGNRVLPPPNIKGKDGP